MRENTAGDSRSVVSDKQSPKLQVQETSESLPKDVSLHLLSLMKSVVAEQINPDTVRAACMCAGEIHKMIKLNLEIKKLAR